MAVAEHAPVDRAGLKAVAERAETIHRANATPAGDGLTPFDVAMQSFRNSVVLALARNATLLLDFDTQMRALDASLDKTLETPGAPDKLLPHAEQMKAAIKSIYDHAIRVREGTEDREMLRAADCIVAGCARLYDIVESMRWRIMEAQADEDIAEGRFKSFPDMKSVLTSLRDSGK